MTGVTAAICSHYNDITEVFGLAYRSKKILNGGETAGLHLLRKCSLIIVSYFSGYLYVFFFVLKLLSSLSTFAKID